MSWKLRSCTLLGDVEYPWRTVSDVDAIPSMICDDERRFLRWAAQTQVRPGQSIVDMGPLAGASTLALAHGARHAGLGDGAIHSFDLWRFFDGHESFFPEEHLGVGDDVLPMFSGNLSEFAPMIIAHQGDLARHNWTGGSIGLMFIDAAKHAETMRAIVSEFYPHLAVGALVIHQDYVSAEVPWVHAWQELLSDFFEVVDSPNGGSVCFRLTKPFVLTSDEFVEFANRSVSVELVRKAAERLVGWPRLCVRLAEAHLEAMQGHPDRAQSILNQVRVDPEYFGAVDYDLDLVATAVKRCLAN